MLLTIENNYRFGETEVAARQHNGTDESAIALTAWINAEKGKAEAILIGEYEYDKTAAHIWIQRLDSPIKYIVRPGMWVIRRSSGLFYSAYSDVFEKYYRKMEITEVPS